MKNEEFGGNQNERSRHPVPSKTLKKHWLEQLLRVSNFTFEIPYKTNGKFVLFEPKSEHGLKFIKKALDFHYKMMSNHDSCKT